MTCHINDTGAVDSRAGRKEQMMRHSAGYVSVIVSEE
jgi:hypothetical protein